MGGSGRLRLPCCLIRNVRLPSSLVTVGCDGFSKAPERELVVIDACCNALRSDCWREHRPARVTWRIGKIELIQVEESQIAKHE